LRKGTTSGDVDDPRGVLQKQAITTNLIAEEKGRAKKKTSRGVAG